MSDIVAGYTWVDGEKGVTAGKMNNVISGAVIQPDFYLNKATSATIDPTDQLLELKGAGSYARITGSALISSVSSQVNVLPQIYSTRLRSFNAVGNPNFEVDQRNCGAAVALITTTPGQDRWWAGKNSAATLGGNSQQIAGNVAVPGTNFNITSKFLRINLLTAQTTLAAGDYLTVTQSIEGPQWRELSGDVHSLQFLVRSSVANLTFSIGLVDPVGGYSIVYSYKIVNANTLYLAQFPNIPVFTGSGSFTSAPGSVGYQIRITLAAGSTWLTGTGGSWVSGNFMGLTGMSNFAAQTGTFDIAFVQHEPGAVCTTLMDVPFSQNHHECLRYYTKSYDYGTKPGTASINNGSIFWSQVTSGNHLYAPIFFKRTMAKVPTAVTGYSPVTGAANSLRNFSGSADVAISGPAYLGDNGFCGFFMTSPPTGQNNLQVHYTADTNW